MFIESEYFNTIKDEFEHEDLLNFLNIIHAELKSRCEILTNAHQEKDYEKLTYIGHKLASGLDTIYQLDLANLARSIEHDAMNKKINTKNIDMLINCSKKIINEIRGFQNE